MSGTTPAGFGRPILELAAFPSATDSTIYLPANAGSGAVEKLMKDLPAPQRKASKCSVDCSVMLKRSSDGKTANARITACRCFRGAQWSITIRLEQAPPPAPGSPSVSSKEESHFELSDSRGDGFFCSLSQMRDILYEQIMADSRRTGLVVIAGATASGKSEIARGMIFRRMIEAAVNARRRPHLITFEDPIEKFYIKGDAAREVNQPFEFDYTPREKGVDAIVLRSVLKDALRQTPTLVFVGEIRDAADWAAIVDFAGTGHSVIATAHASSLTETWGKILSAIGARSPAQRSDLANRVLGVVHLRTLPESKVKGAFPSFWRYTPSAAKALMAEGRGSLVPLRKGAKGYSFGRVWFIEHFSGSVSDELKKAAFASDLEAI